MDQTREAGYVCNPSAPFRDVEHALRVAYGHENMDVCKINSYVREIHGSSVSLFGPETPNDRLAGAAMLRAAVIDHLTAENASTIDAHYTVPKGINGEITLPERRKLDNLKKLATRAHRRYPAPAFAFLCDVTLQWGGYGRRHPDLWWRRKLGVSFRQIMQWKNGSGRSSSPGIFPVLNAMLSDALRELEEMLWRTDAIQYRIYS